MQGARIKNDRRIFLAPSQMDNVEAITQSMAQESPQRPHKSISLHLGGPSGVFLGWGQPPGIPRGSNPVSRGNELEEPDLQSDALFDLTFVLTFDLNISGTPLIAGECGGQAIFPEVSLGPGSTFILMALWAGERRDICKSPKRARSMEAGRLLPNTACTSPHCPIRKEGGMKGEGDPNGYIQAAPK